MFCPYLQDQVSIKIIRPWDLLSREERVTEEKAIFSSFVTSLSLAHKGEKIIGGFSTAAAAAKSLQSCLTLCDPRDSSPSGSPIPGILQAITLEWVAISFSKAWKWKVKVKSLSRVRLFATPWTVAYQAPPPMGFSRQEYWSRLPLPSPDFPLLECKCNGAREFCFVLFFSVMYL